MENSKFDSICSCICGNAKQFQFHFQSNSVPRAIDFHSFFFEVAHIFVFISYHNPPIRCMSSFQCWLKILFNSVSFSLLWRSRLTMMRPHDSNLMTTSLPFAHRFGETIHCSWTLRDDGRGLIISYLPEKLLEFAAAARTWVGFDIIELQEKKENVRSVFMMITFIILIASFSEISENPVYFSLWNLLYGTTEMNVESSDPHSSSIVNRQLSIDFSSTLKVKIEKWKGQQLPDVAFPFGAYRIALFRH